MASVFKRSRWVDANGQKCKGTMPGAKRVKSRFYTVQIVVDGRTRCFKGYSDKGASLQLGAKLERSKAQGAESLEDPFKVHRGNPLANHVADWIAELRQLGRDEQYIAPCKARMERLIAECGWRTLSAISADSFIRWREMAVSTVGTSKVKGSNVGPMGARTQNHYLEALRTFCRWAIKRKRLGLNPIADVGPVETTGKLRRQRRALTESEIAALLAVVPQRHQIGYRVILQTGLRRAELRQLRWGDVNLEPPMQCIRLRSETTKGRRADILPLRADLAGMLAAAKGKALPEDRICRTMPSITSHKLYLAKAGIPFEDEQGRRADFHALRHTYGTMLAKAGIAPRVAMSLMRHTDIRLTMNTYTDPQVFDLVGAVEKLPSLDSVASESVSSQPAPIGYCPALICNSVGRLESSLTPVNCTDMQQKSPTCMAGENKRAMGLEPTTATLGTSYSTN